MNFCTTRAITSETFVTGLGLGPLDLLTIHFNSPRRSSVSVAMAVVVTVAISSVGIGLSPDPIKSIDNTTVNWGID